MKSSEALKLIRPLIEDNLYTHICNALYFKGASDTKVAHNIAVTCGKNTIVFWLRKNSVEANQFLENPLISDMEKRDALIQYRLAWIDWMIPQYEKAGD